MPKHAWAIAAVVCDRILNEKDGSVTLVRLVDRVTVRPPQAEDVQKGTPIVPLLVFVAIRGDEAADYQFSLQVISPSGETKGPSKPESVRIEGPHRGINVNARVPLAIS
jgi:hypothetical protein